MTDDPHDEPETWMEGYLLGWDAQTCIDRFRAFVARPFDDCGLEDVMRFEAALAAEGVNPGDRGYILERVESVLCSSRWHATEIACPLCDGIGRIDVAQIRETGRRIYACDACERYWDSVDAIGPETERGTWPGAFADLKWWHLAPNPER